MGASPVAARTRSVSPRPSRGRPSRSPLDVTDSAGLTIDGGSAKTTVSGGGSVRVFSVASGAKLDLRNLTVAGGNALGNDSFGGGIFNQGGTVTVNNSTFSDNRVENVGGAIGTIDTSQVTVTNSTFSGNFAELLGGAIYNGGVTSNVALRNTIVANNNFENCGGPSPAVTDDGGNLDEGATCGFTASSSKSNTPAGLDPAGLKDNGGPTETIALCSGVETPTGCAGPSAAIDAAVECPPPASDQRGVSRPQGSACDIGAFELDQPPIVTINQASGQADPTTDSPIHFTAVFNEPVTGFTDSDVTLSGTAGATTADVTEIAPNDGTTYDVAVSGMTTDGTVIASIPANAAQDADQNGNAASTSTDNTVDFDAPNIAPTAVGDSYTTNEDTPLTANGAGSNPAGVLANDTDPDGDSLNAVLVSGPSHAATNGFTLNQDGSFSYTPAANFFSTDNFTYKATDGSADSNVATVTTTVTSVNDAPTVEVAAGGVCGTNDRSGRINLTLDDLDGPEGSLTLSATSSNQALVPTPSNVTFGGAGAARTLRATALSGRTGTTVLTVTVSDGQNTGKVEVTLKVDGNGSRTTNGTEGTDLRTDLLFGQNGNDALNGLDGKDLLCGGRGNDNLTGGDDADHFGGGHGTDTATDFSPGDSEDGTIENF